MGQLCFLDREVQGHGAAVPEWNNDTAEVKRKADEGTLEKELSKKVKPVASKDSDDEVRSPLPKGLQGKTPPMQRAATPSLPQVQGLLR